MKTPSCVSPESILARSVGRTACARRSAGLQVSMYIRVVYSTRTTGGVCSYQEGYCWTDPPTTTRPVEGVTTHQPTPNFVCASSEPRYPNTSLMGRAADAAPLPLALPTPSRDAPEMLRSFNAEVDGPANSAEAQRYRVVQGERICGWSCDPAGPYYEQDKGLCPAQCLPGYVRPPRKRRYETIPDVCSSQPPPLPAVKGQASCSGNAASLTAAGIWMLVGVQTGPAHLGRRDGVRASWKQWENGAGVLVCFLIGRVGVTRRQLLTLDAEEKQHGDIMWLENATDAGVPTVKGFHWWRAAARLLPPPGSQRGVRIAAKVDDDSFLCAAPPAARARAARAPSPTPLRLAAQAPPQA